MNPIEVVCPKCQASIGAKCTFKVRDGCQTQDEFHSERKVIPLAPLKEPIFVLRAQDSSASQLVSLWIAINQRTASPEKLASAQSTLDAMRAWPIKKVAD